jgi:uncharacterized protein YciI
MDFLCVLKLQPFYNNPANWTDATNQTLEEHWNYLVKLHEQGQVKFVARTNYEIGNEMNRGYAIYTAPLEQEARNMVMNDPCIVNAIMEAELHPLSLFMLGDKTFY